MIIKILTLLIFFNSCSNINLNKEKHRYILIDEIFKSTEKQETQLEKIYQVLGRPTEKMKEKDYQYIFCDETKTNDFRYSITLKSNQIVGLLLVPSENREHYLKISKALKIFAHLKLNQSRQWNTKNPHVVYEEFFYRTKNKKFEIQYDEKEKVSSISWFR